MSIFKTPTIGSKWECIADCYGVRKNYLNPYYHIFRKGDVAFIERRDWIDQKVTLLIHSPRTIGFSLFDIPIEQLNMCFKELEEEIV
jgi:hypothetical protein